MMEGFVNLDDAASGTREVKDESLVGYLLGFQPSPSGLFLALPFAHFSVCRVANLRPC